MSGQIPGSVNLHLLITSSLLQFTHIAAFDVYHLDSGFSPDLFRPPRPRLSTLLTGLVLHISDHHLLLIIQSYHPESRPHI